MVDRMLNDDLLNLQQLHSADDCDIALKNIEIFNNNLSKPSQLFINKHANESDKQKTIETYEMKVNSKHMK